jgi:membrane fusion protein (multidrug efflux system)
MAEIECWKAQVETARIIWTTPCHSAYFRTNRESSVTDGALVTAYQPMPLATIQQMDPIYVDVTQSSPSCCV